MRRQKTEEAAALSLRIEKEIARFNSRELCSLDTAGGTKKLWAAVRRIAGGEERKDELHINAEDLNSHYAAISMDPTYQQPTKRLTARPDVQLLGESVIFGILDHLCPTAAGLDLIRALYLEFWLQFAQDGLQDCTAFPCAVHGFQPSGKMLLSIPCQKPSHPLPPRISAHLSCFDPVVDLGAHCCDFLHLSGNLCSSYGQSGCRPVRFPAYRLYNRSFD